MGGVDGGGGVDAAGGGCEHLLGTGWGLWQQHAIVHERCCHYIACSARAAVGTNVCDVCMTNNIVELFVYFNTPQLHSHTVKTHRRCRTSVGAQNPLHLT